MISRKNITVAIFSASLLFIMGCSVGKNYKRPELNTPSAYRSNAASVDSTTIADLPWKDFFSDVTLQGLIEKSLTRNYDVRLAIQNIEGAKQSLKQSRAAFAPNISANAGVSVNRPSGSSLNGISLNQFLGRSFLEDYTLGATISWEIDIWGKMRRQKESAKAEFMRTNEMLLATRTQLVTNVAGGYYNLLMLDAQLETAKKNLALNDSVLQITKLRKDVGQVTQLAVELVEAQQQGAALLIPQLEQQIFAQENALHLLAGEFPDRIERATKLNEVTITDNLSAGFPLSVLSRRPDVKSHELYLRSANARVGAAQASMYPSLVINLTAGLNSFTAGNWFNIPGALFGTFFGGITQPLFNRRQLKTQFELAKVERERAIIEFEKSVVTAVGEVSDAMMRVEKLKIQQTIANNRVNTVRSAVANARLLYESGMADYLEVITAQGNLLQVELEASAITCNLYVAKVELYRSLGGGWK